MTDHTYSGLPGSSAPGPDALKKVYELLTAKPELVNKERLRQVFNLAGEILGEWEDEDREDGTWKSDEDEDEGSSDGDSWDEDDEEAAIDHVEPLILYRCDFRRRLEKMIAMADNEDEDEDEVRTAQKAYKEWREEYMKTMQECKRKAEERRRKWAGMTEVERRGEEGRRRDKMERRRAELDGGVEKVRGSVKKTAKKTAEADHAVFSRAVDFVLDREGDSFMAT